MLRKLLTGSCVVPISHLQFIHPTDCPKRPSCAFKAACFNSNSSSEPVRLVGPVFDEPLHTCYTRHSTLVRGTRTTQPMAKGNTKTSSIERPPHARIAFCIRPTPSTVQFSRAFHIPASSTAPSQPRTPTFQRPDRHALLRQFTRLICIRVHACDMGICIPILQHRSLAAR